MSELLERDAMICRSCANEERASEGYPCIDCGTFVCLMCILKGVERCASCTAALVAVSDSPEVARLEMGTPVSGLASTQLPPASPASLAPVLLAPEVPRTQPILPAPITDWPEH